VPSLIAEPVEAGSRITLPRLTGGIGWRIWRSDTPGSQGEVIATLAGGSVYIDVNVSAGKTYYYTVREVFANGTLGEASKAVGVKTVDEIAGGDASAA